MCNYVSPSASGAAPAAWPTRPKKSKKTPPAKKKRGARRPPGHAEEDLTMHMMGVFADAELEADASALYAVSDDGGMRYDHSGGEFASDGEGF